MSEIASVVRVATVTPEMITLGVRRSSSDCPVALAMVASGYGWACAARCWVATDERLWRASYRLGLWLADYDDGHCVGPIGLVQTRRADGDYELDAVPLVLSVVGERGQNWLKQAIQRQQRRQGEVSWRA